MSKLFVRPVDVERDQERLRELLHRNLGDLDHARRFSWLYLDNPAGRARAWFICNGSDNQVVGSASVFPRHVWIGDELHRCGQVGDFAVDPSFRSLGPALQLQKATFLPVDEGELTFCYDCPPHDRGMAPFRRLGLSPVCRMARYVRPLAADELVRKHVPGGVWIQKPIALALNGLLRLRDAGLRSETGLTIEPHPGTFGDEFDELDRRVARNGGAVRCRRFAEELNWRYRADPLHRYQMATARLGGELEGFAVYQTQGSRAFLIETSAPVDSTRAALMHWVSLEARRRGCSVIESMSVHASAEASRLSRWGFRFRGLAQSVVPYFGRDAAPVELEWRFTGLELLA